MDPIHAPQYVCGQMQGRGAIPLCVYVIAHFLHLLRNEMCTGRAVLAAADLDSSGSVEARIPADAVKGDSMEPQNRGRPQHEPQLILDVALNDFDDFVDLPE